MALCVAGVVAACALWRMNALTLPPIYVISLPGDPKRQLVSAHLAAFGLTFTFVDATDGALVTAEKFDETAHAWRPGPKGCALSHMKLWASLAPLGQPAIIFEDDVVLSNEWDAGIRQVLKDMGSLDLIMLGHCAETQGEPLSPILRRSVFPRCTHAYLASPAGLRALAAWADSAVLKLPIDEELARLCRSGAVSAASCFPSLAGQR